jgi:citrate lyase subunit beta / citryl-CoA lyase
MADDPRCCSPRGGIDILEGVNRAFQNKECAQGAEMGMDRKTLFHPKQIATCHTAFSPSDAEIDWARKINDTFDQPENAGKGAIQVEGKMVCPSSATCFTHS